VDKPYSSPTPTVGVLPNNGNIAFSAVEAAGITSVVTKAKMHCFIE